MGADLSHELGGSTEGYHVLRVQENSPGYKAGLEAFFDFIVAIGNTRLDKDNDMLRELLKANAEREVALSVYNSKTQSVRQVALVPTGTWGGQGLLGISIRFCSFDRAADSVWHILDVESGSPADNAGFSAYTDYIIGAETVLHDAEDFYHLIDTHHGRPLKLYVYNTALDACREVVVTPNSNWGGDGSLGCGIGYGYLHQIPNVVRDKATSPVQPAHTCQLGSTQSAVATAAPQTSQSASHVPSVSAPLISGVASSAVTPATPSGQTVPAMVVQPGTPMAGQPGSPMAGQPVTMAPQQVPSAVAVDPVPTFDPRAFGTVPTGVAMTAPSGLLSGPSMASAANVLPPPAPLPSIPGMPVSTPINLPGLPPITVSATLPASMTDPSSTAHVAVSAGAQ